MESFEEQLAYEWYFLEKKSVAGIADELHVPLGDVQAVLDKRKLDLSVDTPSNVTVLYEACRFDVIPEKKVAHTGKVARCTECGRLFYVKRGNTQCLACHIKRNKNLTSDSK